MNTVITALLSKDEKLLWSGQPRQGVVVRASDALMIPFSLLWGGFAFYWEYSVINSDAPAFFVLWGIPFVAIGIYMIVGRFFIEAKQRANIHYAVTSERVLIVSGLMSRKVKSMNLRTLSDLSLAEGKGSEGTISFGGGSPFSTLFSGFSGWPGMGQHLGPSFDTISNAKTVFETIRDAQRIAV